MTQEAVPNSRFNMRNPVHLLATGFGSGLAPIAPGTFGTLAAIPFYLAFTFSPLWGFVLFTLVVSIIGAAICGKAADDIGVHDHKAIVWDEFAGYFVTMCFVPFSWTAVIVGFVLFRFFDIIKPWPISVLDRKVHGGLGIMIDDIVAGFAAGLCLYLIMPLFA